MKTIKPTKTIRLTLDGYWIEEAYSKNDIPKEPGVYCVYSCTFNKLYNDISIRKLIYVGESDNVRSRITEHERLEDWKRHLRKRETLCYSFAPIADEDDRERAEAAIINYFRPPENTDYVNGFPFESTRIRLFVKPEKLFMRFPVWRTL